MVLLYLFYLLGGNIYVSEKDDRRSNCRYVCE